METISQSFLQLVFLFIEVFLIVYVLKSHSNNFVKGVFVISFILGILNRVIFTLALYVHIESLYTVFFQSDGFLHYANESLSYLSFFLLLLGLSFLFGKSKYEVNEKKELIGGKRNIWISLLLFIITAGLYFPFWLYRTVKDLDTNFYDDVPFTPGKAVGYLFIPVYNIYWLINLIFSLPMVISKIEIKYFKVGHDFYLKPAFISILMLLLPIASNLMYYSNVDSNLDLSVLLTYLLIFNLNSVFLYLTLQAKINGFYDYNSKINQ